MFPGHGRPQDGDLTRLRKEVRHLREADEILKKAAVIFVQTGPRYSVKEIAGVPGLSAGACYKQAKYGVSERRVKADAELPGLIRGIVTEHHFRYGRPRVRRELWEKYGKRESAGKTARDPAGGGNLSRRPARAAACRCAKTS